MNTSYQQVSWNGKEDAGYEESFKKRLPRELKSEIGKYLVVLILMIATIGFVSGFLVADGSMLKAYNEGFGKVQNRRWKFPDKEENHEVAEGEH